jgi:hypothetical protein
MALALCLPACVTHTQSSWTRGGAVPVTLTEPTRAWSIEDAGQTLGFVVLFAAPGDEADPTRHYFSVRNVLHQELGTVDALGRAWRFVPHQREAAWIGTGTVVEGARAILDAGVTAELVELTVSELRHGSPLSTAQGTARGAAPTPSAGPPHPRP